MSKKWKFCFVSLHDPFPDFKKVISIGSGVVSDNNINCYNARENVIASMTYLPG